MAKVPLAGTDMTVGVKLSLNIGEKMAKAKTTKTKKATSHSL